MKDLCCFNSFKLLSQLLPKLETCPKYYFWYEKCTLGPWKILLNPKWNDGPHFKDDSHLSTHNMGCTEEGEILGAIAVGWQICQWLCREENPRDISNVNFLFLFLNAEHPTVGWSSLSLTIQGSVAVRMRSCYATTLGDLLQTSECHQRKKSRISGTYVSLSDCCRLAASME